MDGFFASFYPKYFNSEQEIIDYVSHPDYEVDEERPGLCASIVHV